MPENRKVVEGFICFRALKVRETPDGAVVDVELFFEDRDGSRLCNFPVRALVPGNPTQDFVRYAPAQLRVTNLRVN
jgi:hypothetical protein